MLVERLLHLVGELVGLVARLCGLARLLVGLRIRLGLVDHPVDLVIVEPGARLDADLLLLAGAQVLRRHVDDAVRVDVECDLDLRHAARCRGNAHQLESAQRPVLARHLALTLEHVDAHRLLVVLRGAEDLALARGDRRVPLDQLREHAAERLDTERERRHVEQEHVVDVARQHARLHGRAHGDDLVRVDPLVRVLTEGFLHQILDRGDARRSTHEDHLVNIARVQVRVGERLLHRLARPLDEIAHELLEPAARQRVVQVLRPALVRGDEREVDLRLLRAGELLLRVLRRFLQPLERHPVAREVDRVVVPEALDEPVDYPLVEVVAAQMRVAVGALHLVDVIRELEDRDVERTAAQVVDRDLLLAAILAEPVRERRCGGLVDDPLHLQARDPSGVLGRLTLRVVEVGRDGDHRVGDLFAQVVLGGLLHLLQHRRRNLGRGVLLAAHLDPDVAARTLAELVRHHLHLARHFVVLTAHEPLHRGDGVVRVRDHLVARRLAHQPLALVREGDDARGRATAFGVLDHDRLSALHNRYDRVRCTQVDSDCLACHIDLHWPARGRCVRAPLVYSD